MIPLHSYWFITSPANDDDDDPGFSLAFRQLKGIPFLFFAVRVSLDLVSTKVHDNQA